VSGAHTSEKPGIGDTCYSQHGQHATLVARSAGSYIVRPIFEDDDGEHEGEVETWSVAFRTPPAPKLDKETVEAEQRLIDLRTQYNALWTQHNQLERDSKARMERLKQHEELAELDRYLAGEITHYVATHDYYPTVEIIPVGETVEDCSSSNGYGMLSLMPSRTWDKRIVFSVYYKDRNSRYSGDSRKKTVVPCCGEAEAKAKAAEILAGYVADYMTKEPARRNYFDQLIAQCGAHGVLVPQRLIDEHIEQIQKSLQQQREKALQSLAEIDAKLAAQAAAITGETA
jgi:hypothetical protein